ncbi:hypothetical protein OROHE_017391 [Orobanche hederae]
MGLKSSEMYKRHPFNGKQKPKQPNCLKVSFLPRFFRERI